MHWLKILFHDQPFADRTLCHFLKRRLTLPALSLTQLFPDFEEQLVSVGQLPRGSWSTPLADLVVLAKIALCANPKRLMEIGSYRGCTALFLARHLSPEARIVTIDRHPDHGEAYRGTRFAEMIERRVGEIDRTMFARDERESFDLIFVDADHSYESVRHDTELALPLLAPDGFIIWHDYANWGYFSGQNGVPEFLGELAQRLPIGRILGSTLAIHSPIWISGAGRERFLAAMEPAHEKNADPWLENSPRG